jgi:hypothetical protein
MTKTEKWMHKEQGILFKTFEFLSLDIVSYFVLGIYHFKTRKTIKKFD